MSAETGCGCCSWVIDVDASRNDFFMYASTHLEMTQGSTGTVGDLNKSLKKFLCNKCYNRLDDEVGLDEITVQQMLMYHGKEMAITIWCTTTDQADQGRKYPMDLATFKLTEKDHKGFFKFNGLRKLCYACGSKEHATISCEELHYCLDALEGILACKFCTSAEHPSFFCESENAKVD
jgi:hypothetical protein